MPFLAINMASAAGQRKSLPIADQIAQAETTTTSGISSSSSSSQQLNASLAEFEKTVASAVKTTKGTGKAVSLAFDRLIKSYTLCFEQQQKEKQKQKQRRARLRSKSVSVSEHGDGDADDDDEDALPAFAV